MEAVIVVVIVIAAVYIVYKIFTALFKWILIGLVVVLAIAFFSNPDELNHKKKFKDIAKNLPFKIKNDAIQVDNYKVFSLARVNVKDGKKTVGVGMFGKIWYFDDVKESSINP
jgi:hypothetical protein